MELTKNELIGLIQYVSGELKEDLIDITEQDAESILGEYLEFINTDDVIKSFCECGREKEKDYDYCKRCINYHFM